MSYRRKTPCSLRELLHTSKQFFSRNCTFIKSRSKYGGHDPSGIDCSRCRRKTISVSPVILHVSRTTRFNGMFPRVGYQLVPLLHRLVQARPPRARVLALQWTAWGRVRRQDKHQLLVEQGHRLDTLRLDESAVPPS